MISTALRWGLALILIGHLGVAAGQAPQDQASLDKLQHGGVDDVSQLTPDGVPQTLAISKAPVIASHSAVRALVDSARNLSDRELDAIKTNGGVVQVTAFNTYLVPPPADLHEKVRTLRTQYGLTPDFPDGPIGAIQGVDPIDYIVKRIGIDHVGIGTDFNHGAGIIGFQDESEAPNVTRELVRRGYDEKQIAKIWRGNFLRVFTEVEAVSRRLHKS